MPVTDASLTAGPHRALLPLPAVHIRSTTLLLIAVFALGCAARVAAFASTRPLWIDEAMLAENIVERSMGELLLPLDHNQTAPLGFLLLLKLCVIGFGPSEWAFRLVPFVGSLLGLGAFAVAAFRWLPPIPARLSVLLFAMSPTLVGYANEAKQYSTDAAVSAALLACTAPLFNRSGGRGKWRLAAVAGSAAVWLSHPAAFLLGGLAVAFLTRSERRAAVGIIAAWATSFVVLYTVHLRYISGNRYLTEYWTQNFLPLGPEAMTWLMERTVELFRTAGGFGSDLFAATGLAVLLAGVGCVTAVKERRQWQLTGIGAVIGLTLLASAFKRYPFSGRLLLFLAPLLLLLVASGTTALVEAVKPWSRAVGWMILGVVISAPLAQLIHDLRHPPRCEDLPAAMRFVHKRWQPGDRVYVYNGRSDAGAGPAFRFYSRSNPLPDEAVLLGGEYRGESLAYRDEVFALPRAGRVWVLFSHRHKDEESQIRAYFDAVGDRGVEFATTGAAVYEYRMR